MMAQKKDTSANSTEIDSVEKEVIKKPAKVVKKAAPRKTTVKKEPIAVEKEEQAKKTEQVKVGKKPALGNRSDRGSILLGAGLLLMGLILLAVKFLHIPFDHFLWPFIFIVPGALVFLTAISSDSSSGEGLSILGGILSTIGLVFLMQSITGWWASWAYIWALIAPTSIGLSQVVYGNLKGRDAIAASGWRLTKIGLSILVVGFVFFELIIGISGFGLSRFGLPTFPMILIFFGAFILIRSLLKNR